MDGIRRRVVCLLLFVAFMFFIGGTAIAEEPLNTTLNINTATVEELSELKGIGEKKAKSIVEYREQNGHFEDKEQIKNVKGVGAKLFEKIKDLITVE